MEINAFLHSGALISIGRGELLVGWGERRWKQERGAKGSWFYFPDFFLESKHPWFTHREQQQMSVAELKRQLTLVTRRQERFCFELEGRSQFLEAFLQIKQLMHEQSVQKVVPYVFARAAGEMTKKGLAWCLRNLLSYATEHPVFIYGFWGGKQGVIGGSPELLFSMKGKGQVETVALAGTYSSQRQGTLLDDLKERCEHRFVIEGICEALASFGPVSVGRTAVLPLAHLSHLITPLTLEDRGDPKTRFGRLVAALHPTPALGGYPRKVAWEWLQSYHKRVARGRFGAPVGYLRDGRGSCYVAIRNMQWDHEGLSIGAGCGVVAESDREREWEELELKVAATRQILAV